MPAKIKQANNAHTQEMLQYNEQLNQKNEEIDSLNESIETSKKDKEEAEKLLPESAPDTHRTLKGEWFH